MDLTPRYNKRVNLNDSLSPPFTSVGICMVATNKYIEFWKKCALDLEKNAFTEIKNVTLHLFTNHDSEAQNWANNNLKRVKLRAHKIDGFGWPEATLFRYKFINNIRDEFSEDLLMYLDSDMEVTEKFGPELDPRSWINGLAFVAHPGFTRNSGTKGLLDFLKYPRLLIPYLNKLRDGARGIGTWENSKASKAFVAPRKRRRYVHGAIWFGAREPFLEMCRELNNNVENDYRKNIIAKWHDESHLNWFYAYKNGTVLSSRYSGYKPYKYLETFKPIIFTVEKNAIELRDTNNG